MSRIDLKAIDATFLRGLTAFSSGGAASSRSSGNTSAAQVSLGLRVGAQTYAQSLQNFNSLISTVNVSKASLEKLGELTDEMITIAERATKSFISDGSRRSLDVQLKRVANKFRDVVEDAQVGDRDLLSKDGLKEVFALVGLDPENAETISAIFEDIQNPDRDAVLASEKNRGSRPVAVPKASFPGASSSDSWLIERASSAASGNQASAGMVSSNSSVWIDDDNYNNQNPGGSATLAAKTTSGNLNTLASTFGYDVELLSVSEVSGYSLIKSRADFLGENFFNEVQAFIVDTAGQVIQQVTNFSSGEDITTGDLSSDGTNVAIASTDFSQSYLTRYQIASVGSTPASSVTSTDIEALLIGQGITKVQIDESGSSIAMMYNGLFRLYDGSNTLDAFTADLAGLVDFGFLGTNLAGGVYANGTTAYREPGGAVFGTGAVPITGSAIFAFSEAGTSGAYGYRDSAGNVGYSFLGGSAGVAYTISGTPANITSLSMAEDANGNVIFGLFGTMNNTDFVDTTNQLYRVSLRQVSQNSQLTTITTAEPDNILSGTIAKRPEAFRMLTDLKKLREQISNNIKALDGALEVIGENVSLVRATGLAMLDIRNELTGAEDAEQVAKLLRDRIARDAGVALLAQAENLTPIAFAALNTESEDN